MMTTAHITSETQDHHDPDQGKQKTLKSGLTARIDQDKVQFMSSAETQTRPAQGQSWYPACQATAEYARSTMNITGEDSHGSQQEKPLK
jgi:hypothetical protein